MPVERQWRSGWTGRDRAGRGSALLFVAPTAGGQELLQLRRALVGARHRAVLVGEERGQRVALHVGVVPLLEGADEARELIAPAHLLVDLRDELPALLPEAVGREDEARGRAHALQRRHRGERELGVGEVVRYEEHESGYRLPRLGQAVLH